ncbi:MAG: IscS subfamily cysteine desulfurase [Acidobacteria bacterium]|nr:IscS subfamily cysteine desulfurase [Acidobacteriota bacterium]
MKRPVYLDYHATTPVDRRVCDAMLPYFCETFGNAASKTHPYGWDAADAVQLAREQVARLVGVSAKEICFTSGGTEANNLAVQGAARANRARGNHIVTACTEHSSVIDTARHLEEEGFRVTVLPVGADGLIDLNRLEDALDDRTLLVSVMAGNNEIGVLQPIREAAAIAAKRGVPFHTDAVQAAGKVPFDVAALGVDLASMSAHKMYGPKGIGALVVRRRKPGIEIEAMMHGGRHEQGLRSGTLNVPGIVGFGRAAEICAAELETEAPRLASLRDRLLGRLRELGGVTVNGSLERRLPHNLNVAFAGVEPEALLMSLGDLAISTGSACASASAAPSHVLTALGLGDDLARASLRFGLGRFTTEEEIDFAADRVANAVRQLREKAARLGVAR